MKNITTPAIAILLIISGGIADAAPWNFFRRRPPAPPHQEERHNDRRHDDRRDDRDHRGERQRPMRIEAKAQLRLRELGFYRGPVDGEFGPGSRGSLARFQRSRGLRPTGTLNEPTMRALRL